MHTLLNLAFALNVPWKVAPVHIDLPHSSAVLGSAPLLQFLYAVLYGGYPFWSYSLALINGMAI